MTEQNPESTGKHDPYVNKAFNALFEDEANADVVRMFDVGLAAADDGKPISFPDDVPLEGVHEGTVPSGTDEVAKAFIDALTAMVAAHEDFEATQPERYQQTRDDVLVAIDGDGDAIQIVYTEHHCPAHGVEPGIAFAVTPHDDPENTVAHVMPIESIPTLIEWLQSRVAKAQERHPEA